MKVGAGVQAFEVYAAAEAQGLRVVGGSCPTVALAGGFSQGGGHSALSSVYGLAADQTLEWEFVTADGKLLTASPTENQDLYWALSGGGGGTYGVVISMTSKAYPDGEVGGASLSFSSANISQDLYWGAVGSWYKRLPAIADDGSWTGAVVTNEAFTLHPISVTDKSTAEVTAMLDPFITDLKRRNITYSLNVTSHPTFTRHVDHYFGPLPYGAYTIAQLTGGRIIPRSVVETNHDRLVAAIRNVVKDGKFYFAGVGLNVSHKVAGNTPSSNAVLSAWREALVSGIIVGPWDFTVPWEEMVARENELTNEIIPPLQALTPESGTYLNEADFQTRTWKKDFYGSNYGRLKSIKNKHDPNDLFYAKTAVGSDAWTVAGDGRLCRS